ncbi:acetamidase/formamidase [Granulicella aggregans]|uniref:Acetamidase/formamidase n=1 Tax=Granulicella aggregans TaxID=474949 RepID=A0A7W7ZD57_9BACT|nr:acetamidase/formamidase family protein [Granulicella aggregans]MBB5057690.1 acetamidase/formamidase [Granulicella aggregans]
MAEFELGAEPTHSVWNKELEPRLEIESGDTVHFECLDASGGQVKPGATVQDFLGIERDRIHALTGPVYVRGSAAGDVLEVEVLEVRHKGWGWTSTIAGLGFLDERFTEPSLFHWDLDGEVSRSLAPAVLPLRPFCGVMGVAPGEAGVFKTRPPGTFGGNMDVRDLVTGSTLYLPVFNAGALFSCGDAHAAQGDGEVCINGIECPADVTLRFKVHKGKALAGPVVDAPYVAVDPLGQWTVVESSPDALGAAKAATSRMVDLLVEGWGFSELHAYLLCSVAMDLRLAQVVNRPMVTVAASIGKSILPGRRLF